MAGKMCMALKSGPKVLPKNNMSKVLPKGVNMSKPAPVKAWTPQKGIPDQSKVKNIGVGWGGEKPSKKK